MRNLVYVSGTRADYGLFSGCLHQFDKDPRLTVSVCVTGMHLMAEHGDTIGEIEADGIGIAGRIPVHLNARDPASMAHAVADELHGMLDVFGQCRPDAVVVLGDRGEMLAGALAALHLGIPVVHVHGGERSGSVDESVRHAISKLSHYHFVATDASRERLIRMDEFEDKIFVTGAPGLDGIESTPRMPREALCEDMGFDVASPIALVLFHPVVQEADDAGSQARIVFESLLDSGIQALCMTPNTDTGGGAIRDVLEAMAASSRIVVRTNLPRQTFLNWMAVADVMVGNSSSGIIEAATFDLPVVNVGNRQRGRERSANVIDVELDKPSIRLAIEVSTTRPREPTVNVYGDGHAGERMVELLASLPMDAALLNKINAY